MKACVDIGGTKVAVSLHLGQGRELVARQSEPTAKTGTPDAVARQVIHLIEQACQAQGRSAADVQAVGISSAGPFIRPHGDIELATPNICGGLAGPERGLPNDWTSAPIERPLRERFGRVRIENDATAALEAERRWGALQGSDHCAYVTWSTGVGVGLCVDGHVLRGKNANAGHAGHTFVVDGEADAICGCGNRGDVEGMAAGNAMERRFGVDAKTLLDAAARGDRQARARVESLCDVMGRMLYNLVATLDLERISLGGSVFWHHRDWLLPRLQSRVAAHLPALTTGARLMPAGLGDRVGDLAALALLD